MKPGSILIALIALLAAGFLPGTTVEAQPGAGRLSSSTTTTPPATPAPEPGPIPVPEIPRQSERALGRLAEIETALAPDPAVADVRSKLPGWTKEVAKLRESRLPRDPASLSLRDLEDIHNAWRARKADLDQWQSTLEARSQSLQTIADELQTMRRRWIATRDDASRELPAAVVRTVGGVLAQIGRVDRAASERLSAGLQLQNELADEASRLQGDLDALDGAVAAARRSLLNPDAPPLWVAFSLRAQDRGLVREAEDSWSEVATTLGKFFVSNRERLALQFLVFLGLLWLFRWLRARSRGLAEREDLKASAHILTHPVANALLIALLLTRVLHPAAPLAAYELSRLLLLVPLLRVLPSLVSPSLRGGIYGLALLYVGDLLNSVVARETLLGRVLLMLVTGAALAGLLSLTRPGGRVAKEVQGSGSTAALFAGRVGAVLLFVSLLASIAGLLRLAELLTDVVLSSAYAAVALFAGVLVVEGLVNLVFDTVGARTLRAVRAKGLHLRSLTRRLVRFVAVVAWVAVTLGAVQLLDPVLGRLKAILSASLSVGELSISLGAVLALVVTIWLSVQISRITRVILDEDVLPNLDLPRGVPGAVSKLAHYSILFVGVLFALAAAGIQLSQFALLAGALGVGIGFGLQNIVNNFVSGLILLFERPIQIGDTVELGKLLGTVSRIGIRSSTIRTFDGAEVIVPNAKLIESEVVNWTLSDRLRRIEVAVGVAYGTPPKKVLALLLEVARAHPQILAEPEPYSLFEGFGDSSLNFILRAWTGNFDLFLRTRSELRVGIHDALEAAGIVIPFPQRDVHIITEPGSPEDPEDEAEPAS